MRRFALVLAATALCAACASAPATAPPAPTGPEFAESHFPEPFPNAYLGMPLASWRATRLDTPIPAGGTFDFRVVVVERAPLPGVAEITWYFDADLPGQPLYEVIVDYGANRPGLQRAVQTLGAPNLADGGWRFATSQAHAVKVWTFSDKIVVAAGMTGTEWDGAW